MAVISPPYPLAFPPPQRGGSCSPPTGVMNPTLLSCPKTPLFGTIQLRSSSHVSALLRKSAFPGVVHVPFHRETPQKTCFLGEKLVCDSTLAPLRKNLFRFLPIRAVVKRRKEMPFDNVIERDKKLKLVLKIRKILVSYPDRIMDLKELGKYRRQLGLPPNRRFIALLKRFPAVFEILEEGVFSLKFRLTPEAERIYLEELNVRNQMEGMLITKLRKLLMMSLEKRILIEKIAHLRTDLGLPLEFRDTICNQYPQYFRVVKTERGPALELTSWDPELAVSVAEASEEENRLREIEEKDLIIDRPLKFQRVKLPKGLILSKKEMRRITQFRDMPYISPYSDFSALKAGTPEKEKHACGVVHEILSLTTEKKTLVDHLTHFREEFRFSQQLRGMLIRHPELFYVSLKGERDSVFLREAYKDSHLVEKDKLVLLKEKLRSLVVVPRFGRRHASSTESDDGASNEGNDDEYSEDDGSTEGDFSTYGETSEDFDEDSDDDQGSDEEDYWSDEDDEVPPDFDDVRSVNYEGSKPKRNLVSLSNPEDKPIVPKVPILPDGRPRERW